MQGLYRVSVGALGKKIPSFTESVLAGSMGSPARPRGGEEGRRCQVGLVRQLDRERGVGRAWPARPGPLVGPDERKPGGLVVRGLGGLGLGHWPLSREEELFFFSFPENFQIMFWIKTN